MKNILSIGLAALLVSFGYSISPSNNLTKHMKPQGMHTSVDEIIVDNFVKEYRNAIQDSSTRYNVPAELIVATIKAHNVGRQNYQDIGDFIGSFIARDCTLGVGQVKISTAKDLEKELYNGRAVLRRDERIKSLNNPSENIEYIAKFYASELRDIKIKDPDEVLRNPAIALELASRYVGGRRHSGNNQLNLDIARYLTHDTTFNFNRSLAEIDTIKEEIKTYLCVYNNVECTEAN